MLRMAKKVLIPIIAVVVVAAGAFWWFVMRSDSPEKLSVGGNSTTTEAGGSSEPVTPGSIDGTWSVSTDAESTIGFRIKEDFAGGLTDHEAVGRSTAVSGSIAIEGTEVTEGEFVVDLTEIEFTDSPGLPVGNRARAMQDRGLQTNTFPEASFKLTSPLDFGQEPEVGKTIDSTITGELTLHGVTKSVTVQAQAVYNGATIEIGTNPDELPEIVLADFEITPPSGGPIASVADTGTFEFLVTLTKS